MASKLGTGGGGRIAPAIVLALALALALAGLDPGTVRAASITVTTTADGIDAAASCAAVTIASLPGPGGQTSLREAVCAANNTAGADTITFAVNGTFALTGAANEDNGGSGDLDVKQSLSIQGNGSANTVIDGGGIERIFDVFPAAASTFDLASLTVRNGDTRSTSFKNGGAIYLHNNVTTTITACQISNNFSGASGAIENRGSLTITNSVISNNQTIPASGSVEGGAIRNSGPLTITNTTIANNSVRGEGGGIATTVAVGTTVTITGSTISGNSASVTGGGLGNGGGISTTGNDGTITITNSTISGNRADNNGGGAYWTAPGAGTGNATLTNVTVTNNTADNDNNNTGAGGGFLRNAGSVTLRNTIVAGNFNSTAATRDDISGAVVAASSYNLVGDGTGSSGITNGVNTNQVGSGASPINPLLGALVNNGGSTETHALLGGSPAINTANNATCPATDQRGVSRPGGGTCDIGAYELSDTTPPDTTITGTPTNPSGSTSATFTFTGSDNVTPAGSLTFQCQLDGGGFAACTSPRTYTGLADGSHTFQVRATDQAGNTDQTPASFTWVVDATPPNTTITANPTNPSASTTAGFSFTGTDGSGTGVASFQCQLDGDGFAACTSPQTYTGLGQGSHTFQVRAVDAAGNVDPTPAAFTWVIDTVAPDTTIVANPTNPSASANASFSFTGSDPGGSGVAGFECRLDGGGFAACTSPWAYTGLADGAHTFQVRAIDAAGNVDPTPAAFTWVIDTTPPPAPVVITPPNGASTNATQPPVGGTAEAGSTLTIVLDGTAAGTTTADGSGNWSFTPPTPLGDGPHTVRARATDAAGNTGVDSNTSTFTVDTVAPDTTITATPANPANSANASFSFTGNDGGSGVAGFECRLDGGGFAACTSPRTYTGLADGSHTFQVRAIDAAGNVDPTPAAFAWVIDTVAPSVAFSSAAADPTNVSPIPVTVTFSEAVTGFTAAGIATANGTVSNFAGAGSVYTFDLVPSGQGLVTADIAAGVAQDAAGNPNSAAAQFARTYDTGAPAVTINQAAGQADPTNAAPITFTVVFAEPVSGFDGGDVSFAGSTAGGPLVALVSGGPSTYTVSVTGMTGQGTVVAGIPAGAAQDGAGNGSAASTSTDNSVEYDSVAPTVTINQAATQDEPAILAPIRFTVVFSEPVSGFTNAGITLGGTAGATTATVTGGPTTYTVAVSGMTGPGTVTATLAAGAAHDAAGNSSAASTSTDNTVTYAPVPPCDQQFVDVSASDPACEAIAMLTQAGVIRGYNTNPRTFGPTDNVQRSQMAAFLVRALGWQGRPTGPRTFDDFDGLDAELRDSVLILANACADPADGATCVARGYGDGRFGITDPVSHAQVITFIARAFGLDPNFAWQPQPGGALPYTGAPSLHAEDIRIYHHYAGMIPDAPTTQAGWNAPASRAWVARVLYQALQTRP